MRLAPGTVIGKYEVLEERARPGGQIGYTVRHTLLDSLLVMTALPPSLTEQPAHLAQLRTAVRQASALRHDHVLPVVDLVEEDDRYYTVEALVDAEPLAQVLRDGPLAPPDALHVARQLADALAYAHEHGVVHGGVCPANVLLARGPKPQAWLGGFALATLPWDGSPAALPYTAPERLLGAAADGCTDVFGLGLLLFELLEGTPFLTGIPRDIEIRLRDGTGPLVPRFTRMIPAGASGLVARALRRTPGARQQKMSYVRAEIDACLRAVGAGVAPSGTEAALPPPAPEVVERAQPPAPIEVEAVVAPPAPPRLRPVAATTGFTTAAPPPPPSASANDIATPPPPPRAAVSAARPAAAPSPPSQPAPAATAPHRQRIRLPLRRRKREAVFPGRVLLRVSEPRQSSSPIAAGLLLAGIVVVLGWPLLRRDTLTPAPSTVTRSPVAPARILPGPETAPAPSVPAPTPPPQTATAAEGTLHPADPIQPAAATVVPAAPAPRVVSGPPTPRERTRQPTRAKVAAKRR